MHPWSVWMDFTHLIAPPAKSLQLLLLLLNWDSLLSTCLFLLPSLLYMDNKGTSEPIWPAFLSFFPACSSPALYKSLGSKKELHSAINHPLPSVSQIHYLLLLAISTLCSVYHVSPSIIATSPSVLVAQASMPIGCQHACTHLLPPRSRTLSVWAHSSASWGSPS